MFVPRHPTASQKLFFFLCSAEGFGIIPAKIFFVLSKMTRNLRVVFYRGCQVMGVITIQNSSLLDTVSPVLFFFVQFKVHICYYTMQIKFDIAILNGPWLT